MAPQAQAADDRTMLFRGKTHWVFLACLLVILCIVYKDFLLGEKVLLYTDIGSDSVNGFYPNTVHVLDYLKTEGMPKWSFNRGMGQNIFPGSLSDPSLWFLSLVGKENFAYGIVYVEVIKIILAGVLFFLFLRLLSLSPLTTVIGGLLYAFNGYFILGTSGWFNHSFEPLFAAGLLYAFELWFQRGRWWVLPIAFAVTVSYHAVFLYLFAVLVGGYAMVRYLSAREWRLRAASEFVAKLVGLLALGVGLSSVFLFSSLGQLLESPRVQGELAAVGQLSAQPVFKLIDPFLLMSLVARTFSLDLLGTGDAFRGWGNYLEAPVLYCGLLTLLLAPQLFLRVTGKKRVLLFVVTGCCLLPLVFPYARYLFWGFSGPYFRTLSLFVVLPLLLIALQALSAIEREGKVDRIALWSVAFSCIGLLSVPMLAPSDALDSTLRIGVFAFLVVYAVLVIALTSLKFGRVALVGIILVVIIELAWFSWLPVNKRDALAASDLEQRGLYRDETNDIVRLLRARDPGYYRIEKDYASGPARALSLNDAQVQGYYGTASYHSFNQPSYLQFLQAAEVIPEGSEPHARWSLGLRQSPRLHSFAGIKYFLTKKKNVDPYLHEGYQPLMSVGEVTILQNPNALPLGFTYDRYVTETEFRWAPKSEKERVLMKAFVIREQEGDIAQFFEKFSMPSAGRLYTYDEYAADVEARHQDTLVVSQWNQNSIVGTISVDRRKLLFFSIPYDRGWSARVDGKDVAVHRVNIGFIGVVIEAGEHRVELEYFPPLVSTGFSVSIASVLVYCVLLVVVRKKYAALAG
ncbi:MAG TPA: YfhO family protein [Bacteroidota bacterium]|nr:YfhO family protein [Bacteroidota bacterium]